MNWEKLRYLLRCAAFRLSGGRGACPYCGGGESTLIDAKWGVAQLRECGSCALLYRVPTDSVRKSEEFYEEAYEGGDATRLPGPEELERLRSQSFGGFGRSYARHIALLKCLGLGGGAKVLDFGASWGYGVDELRRAGFDAAGFEVSRRRGAFGRCELGVEMLETLDGIAGRFDVFFSSHVLEHLPDLRGAISTARRVTKPGGWFVAVTPNGSPSYRAVDRGAFHQSWGLVHPVLLQDRFVERAFAEEPLFLASDPVPEEALRAWDQRARVREDTSGWELFFAVRLGPDTGPARPYDS